MKNVHKNIKLLSWFNFFTDFRLYSPVAIIYFAKVSGSYALGMSVFSVTMLSSAIFEVPTGIFSDLIGRKKTVIFGSLSNVLATIFYAMGGFYWVLIIGATFEGLARSFYSGNNDALLHDTLSSNKQEHKYHEFLGKASSMFQAALAVSAVLGSMIAHWSFAWVMWLSVIPQVIGFFISLQLIEPKISTNQESTNIFAHTGEAIKIFLKNKKLRFLALGSIIGYGLGESSYQFRSAFVNMLWPLWAVGISKMLSSIGAVISFYLSGKFIKKFGELNLIISSSIISRIINFISFGYVTVVSPALMTTTSLFYGIRSVAKNSLMQKEFTQRQRATMGSLNSLGDSLTFVMFSFLTGILADNFGAIKALIIIEILSLLSTWFYWKAFKHERAVNKYS